jgi:hypothetical protein
MVESLVLAVLVVLIAVDVAAHIGRQRFRRAGDAFRCRVRTSGYTSAIWPRLRRRWSRRMWARWADDVLIVRRGPVLPRTVPLRAHVLRTSVYAVSLREARRLGSDPIAIDLEVGDGSRIELAAQREARLSLVGPFLAAAVSALPEAPRAPQDYS